MYILLTLILRIYFNVVHTFGPDNSGNEHATQRAIALWYHKLINKTLKIASN